MPVEGVQRVRVKAVLSCGPPHSHRQECLQSQTGGRGVSWPVANNFSDPLRFLLGFSGVSDGKESACNAGDRDSIPGSWRRKWQPTPVFLSGEFHGQGCLVRQQFLGSQRVQT